MGKITAGQKIPVQIPDYAELDIRRPNGDIETIKFSGANSLTAVLFAQIKKATLAASRGDVLAYRNVTKPSVVTVTAADAATAQTDAIETMMRHGE